MNGTKSKKSIAKANGLKSTFVLGDDKYFMTSFGKGNTAQIEKTIEQSTIIDLGNTFDAKLVDSIIVDITGAAGTSDVQLPVADNNRLRAKAAIETIFFGETFSDNMHIQIAYNVMDIKKLLAVYANNIIHTVNNLLKTDYNRDFLGMFPTMNDFQRGIIAYNIIRTNLIDVERSGITDRYKVPRNGVYFIKKDIWNEYRNTSLNELQILVNERREVDPFFRKLSNCIVQQLGFSRFDYIENAASNYKKVKNIGLCQYYFSDIFTDSHSEPVLRYVYESLRLLGIMRQTAFHSHEMRNNSHGLSYTLFEIDTCNDLNMKTVLDEITKNKVDALNKNFIDTSTVNLNILFSAYPERDKCNLIGEYYDFSVRKVYKNMGFSVKTLRETIIATEHQVEKLVSKEYDSVRSKLYSLFDFVIYNYYLLNEEKADAFVSELRRQTLTAQDEKSGITYDDKKAECYKKESKNLWKGIEKTIVNTIIPAVEKCKRGNKSLQTDIEKSLKECMDGVAQRTDSLSYFSKAVYCICAFLDGKEINMFLNALIQAFDNIESMKNVVESTTNGKVVFGDSFEFFNHCQNIAGELRFIQSIARMNKSNKALKKSEVQIKGFQYFESAALFGESNQDKVKGLFQLEAVSRSESIDHSLRNFFINNVIESNKYRYVIRFVNPENARKIMQNQAIVSFAIKDIDDSQIIRYCNSANIAYDASVPDFDKMRSALSEKLMNVNFETFSKITKNSAESVEKEQLKALAGLYLTTIYLITKALVRINTSYSIAFSAFERDCFIMNKKARIQNAPNVEMLENVSIQNTPQNITEYFRQSGLLNKRVEKLINRNKKHFNAGVFREFRNKVVHLNVVLGLTECVQKIKRVESYFDLYHYLMLEVLSRTTAGRSIENIDAALEHQTAYKDFLYGILTPFAYNPARYLNLTSKTLFIRGYGK